MGEGAARIFATALGEMTRLANERALYSDTGLTPHAYASGIAVRRGPLRRQGSSRVSPLLVAIAWRAMPRDAVLPEKGDRRAATRGKATLRPSITAKVTHESTR